MLGAKLREASSAADGAVKIRKNVQFTAATANVVPNGDGKTVKGENHLPASWAGTEKVQLINYTQGTRCQGTISTEGTGESAVSTFEPDDETVTSAFAANDRVRLFWEESYTGASDANKAIELVISPSTFPGTYRVIGDALIRNQNGTDEAFQFCINKAKMLSEVTLTMQAEGDPSSFSMTLNVLRDDDGNMMSLRKY